MPPARRALEGARPASRCPFPVSPRASDSVCRTDRPRSRASRATRRRTLWSRAWRTARPCPSESCPFSSIDSTSSGSSSRRTRFEIATRLLPDPLPDLLLGEAELVHERGACMRRLDRVQVLPRHVLDHADLEPSPSGAARTTAGIRSSPARRAARHRRSPASNSYARRRAVAREPAAGRRARTESASSCSSSRQRPSAAGAGWARSGRAGALQRVLVVGRGRQDRRQSTADAALNHSRPPPWRARSTRRSQSNEDRGG